MRYVLDASVAANWVLPEPDSGRAERLRVALIAGTHEAIAPDVFPAEVAHAITRAERMGVIPVGDGRQRLTDLLSTRPRLIPLAQLLDRGFEISSAERHGFNDCVYVALAEREGCEFVTADDKAVAKLQPLFPFVVSLRPLP